MPSDRAAQFTALMDDIQSFRHYIQSERGWPATPCLHTAAIFDRYAQWIAGDGLAAYLTPTLRDLVIISNICVPKVWHRRALPDIWSP